MKNAKKHEEREKIATGNQGVRDTKNAKNAKETKRTKNAKKMKRTKNAKKAKHNRRVHPIITVGTIRVSVSVKRRAMV